MLAAARLPSSQTVARVGDRRGKADVKFTCKVNMPLCLRGDCAAGPCCALRDGDICLYWIIEASLKIFGKILNCLVLLDNTNNGM